MSNRKKLYRSVATTALMLLAGFVIAPTIVTAGFHPATKNPTTPAPTAAAEVALEPSAAHSPRKPHSYHRGPIPVDSTSATDEATPQSEAAPAETGHSDFDGDTTFAINDFAPAPPAQSAFVRGASNTTIALASNDAGGGVAKFSRKPKPPVAGENQSVDSADTVNDDNAGDSKSDPVDHSTDADKNQPGNDKPGEHYADNHPHDERPQASVPEPSSIALLVAGLIGLVVARRRA